MFTRKIRSGRSSASQFYFGLILISGFLSHFESHAQVGFVVERFQFDVCLAQNWDTPTVQAWLAKVSKAQRMMLYGSSKLSGTNKKCLMESKPFPQAHCNQILARHFDPNRDEVGGNDTVDVFESTDEKKLPPKCFSSDDQSNDDWLPADLELSKVAKETLKRANAGDRVAQKKAMELYTDGQDSPPDPKKADYWLRKLADSGDAEAQWQVGQNYRYGRNFYTTNYTKAIHYLSLSAKSGYLYAMNELASVYASDEPHYGDTKVKRNIDQSIYWYTKAAELGNGYAAFSLGSIYEDAENKKKNPKLAIAWYTKAAKLNDPDAMFKLANHLEESRPNDPEKLMEAHQWRRKADALGENGTTLNLAGYFPWPNRPQEDESVIKIQLQHAEKGDTNAQLAMAQRYFNGVGVGKDHAMALKWWTLAAHAGDPIGQRMLGKSYLYGWGTPEAEGFTRAIEWLEKAAAQGDQEAMSSLGFAYINRQAQTLEEYKRYSVLAIQWMHKAADHGYRPEDTRARAALWERK